MFLKRERKGFVFALILIQGLIFNHSLVYSEDKKNMETEEITVTATRSEAEVKEVPPSIEIVTREEIDAVAADDIEDILRFSESIYFYQSMLRSTPSIRGFEGKHVLILVDGKRFAGEQGKFDDPTRITTENIERIEIVRGPMSALYGSEAMGGVINIITKKPEKISVEISGKYGAYSHENNLGTTGFTINLADKNQKGLLGKTGLRVSGTYLEEDPYFIEKNQTLISEREIRDIDGLLTFKFNDWLNAELSALYSETELISNILKGRAPSTYITNSQNIYRRKDFSGRINYNRDGLTAMLGAYTSQYNKDYDSRYGQNIKIGKIQYYKGQLETGQTSFDDGERTTDVIEAQVGKYFSGFLGDHLVTIGGEVRDEGFFSVRNSSEELSDCRYITREGVRLKACQWDNQNISSYLQDEWQLTQKLLIIPAIRYDDNEQFGEELSPKIGLTYKVFNKLRLKANYGHSFRAPGAGELYRDFFGMGGKYHIIGNSQLTPETSDSVEIAAEGEFGGFSGKIAYFHNEIKDLIDTVYLGKNGNASEYQYVNIDEATLQGVEMNADYALKQDITIGLNYTYLNAVNNEGVRIEGKPRHLAHIKFDWLYRPWGIKTNIRSEWKGDYGYINDAGAFDNDHQFLTNIKITKELYKTMDIYAGVNDLFDNTQWGDSVLESPGAFYYTGFNWRF
jgi:outer membrane receptor for ferrienterochelin and colicins